MAMIKVIGIAALFLFIGFVITCFLLTVWILAGLVATGLLEHIVLTVGLLFILIPSGGSSD